MASATYDTSAPKFGAGAMNGGSGSVTLPMAAGSRTIDAWFKGTNCSTVNGTPVVVDSGNTDGLFINTSGNASYYVGGYTIQGSIAACNGAWHHLEVDYSSGGSSSLLFVDGVLSTSNNYIAQPANPSFTIAPPSGTEVDEVRISNVVRHTAAYTEPGTVFTPDANTAGLFHLDGNGNNAAAAGSY